MRVGAGRGAGRGGKKPFACWLASGFGKRQTSNIRHPQVWLVVSQWLVVGCWLLLLAGNSNCHHTPGASPLL
jgi:hypothetical protein